MKKIRGGVTAARGFLAAGITCGIKRSGKPDLALVFSEAPAASAAVFTTNQVKAAPIQVSIQQARHGHAQAIVANSGSANCCTGKQGLADAWQMVEETALLLGLSKEKILVASTGSIGSALPMDKIMTGIKLAAKKLSSKGGTDAAKAILTTDLRDKQIAVKVNGYTLGGLAKGSGMIAPNMATMHAFITTDAKIDRGLLQKLLSQAVSDSFNLITVDNCMSTNDCVFVLANGLSGVPVETAKEIEGFAAALKSVCQYLARQIAADGEGATKLMEVKVEAAASDKDARLAAMAVANSHLFKAAVFGHDPNWGRIMGALGSVPVKLEVDKINIYLGPILLAKGGMGADFDRAKAARLMAQKTVVFKIDLNLGQSSASVWGCDLSYDYVKINARYQT